MTGKLKPTRTKAEIIDWLVKCRIGDLKRDVQMYEQMIREKPSDDVNGVNHHRRDAIKEILREIWVLTH